QIRLTPDGFALPGHHRFTYQPDLSGGEGLRGDAALGDHPNNPPITGADALHAITGPVCTASGTRVPGLRLGEQRSHALLAALPVFRLQPGGFTNKDLRTLARMTTMAP